MCLGLMLEPRSSLARESNIWDNPDSSMPRTSSPHSLSRWYSPSHIEPCEISLQSYEEIISHHSRPSIATPLADSVSLFIILIYYNTLLLQYMVPILIIMASFSGGTCTLLANRVFHRSQAHVCGVLCLLPMSHLKLILAYIAMSSSALRIHLHCTPVSASLIRDMASVCNCQFYMKSHSLVRVCPSTMGIFMGDMRICRRAGHPDGSHWGIQDQWRPSWKGTWQSLPRRELRPSGPCWRPRHLCWAQGTTAKSTCRSWHKPVHDMGCLDTLTEESSNARTELIFTVLYNDIPLQPY